MLRVECDDITLSRTELGMKCGAGWRLVRILSTEENRTPGGHLQRENRETRGRALRFSFFLREVRLHCQTPRVTEAK